MREWKGGKVGSLTFECWLRLLGLWLLLEVEGGCGGCRRLAVVRSLWEEEEEVELGKKTTLSIPFATPGVRRNITSHNGLPLVQEQAAACPGMFQRK